MKIIKILAISFLLICILAICLNLVDSKTVQTADEYPPLKDPVNIMVSVNWTGSITGIGGSVSTDTHYRKQLKSDIRNELHDLIKGLSRDKNLNLSYCFFGLARSENSGENPDFKTNYIKKFKTNCTGIEKTDWISLVNSLGKKNIGHHTALSVARQLSAVSTGVLIKDQFCENYLILISDNYFNVEKDAGISAEMRSLESWSRTRPADEKIRNISYAAEKAKAFYRYYTFSNIKNIPILPGNMTAEERHFEIRVDKIEPKIKQEPSNFLFFPKSIEYEYLSGDSIRIFLDLKYNDENTAFEKNEYIPKKIELSAVTPNNNNCFYQDEFQPDNLPSTLILKKPAQPLFNLEISAYYDYESKGIFNPYREKHEITIHCRGTGSGRLALIWPVKGKLLDYHKSIGICTGQLAAAEFWNFIIIITIILFFLWFIIPKIKPPVPRISFRLEKGRDRL
jgi:hypothetical protein